MSNIEKILWAVLIIMASLGVFWAFSDPQFFTERFNREDGIVEYGTVWVLIASAGVMFWRWRQPPFGWRSTVTAWTLILACVFVAGEEISWGQRLFDLETTEYFKEHNDQEELNLHNLKIGDIKLNKLIFGAGLTVALLLYLVILPFAYPRWPWAQKLVDQWGVPVAQIRHAVAYLLLLVVLANLPASKNWELLEFATVLIILMVLVAPQNHKLFTAT